MATTVFHPASKRGHANHGWLDAHHSFSFAGWYDPSRIHFGALRVLNDDIVAGGKGFGTHPHDNMEIITIVLDGVLEHKDSMGHTQTISPGEVQVMSAGSGVFHSEYNHDARKPVNLLQTWIFPNERNVTPRYDQKMFDDAGRDNKLQALVAPLNNGEEGALGIHQNAWIYRAALAAGQQVTHTLHGTGNGVYVFVINGTVSAEGQTLGRRDALGITDVETVTLTASHDADFLVFELPMSY